MGEGDCAIRGRDGTRTCSVVCACHPSSPFVKHTWRTLCLDEKPLSAKCLFDRMHEVLRSLYTVAAVYKYVLKYKAQFQQAISFILVKTATMQGRGQYFLTLLWASQNS